MSTVYACTHVEKTASDWDPAEGAGLNSTRCILSERVNVVATTLELLVKRLEDKYFLSLDDLFLADDDEDGLIDRFSYNRVETRDSDEPTPDETAQWEAGEIKLYLCDYDFSVEKRQVVPIPKDEFAFITTH